MRCVAWALGLVLVLASGCRGKDISFDCENQRGKFNKMMAEDELPLTSVPAKPPYPVAIQISTAGLNKLLAGVIDEGVPFSGTVPFGVLPTGPASASFGAKDGEVPQISIREVPNCKTCVVFYIDFDLSLTNDQTGDPVSSGVGWVYLYVPLRLDSDETTGKSTLVAEYGKTKIGPWKLGVFGFDSDEDPMLAGALKILLQEEIAKSYEDTELLTLDSWTIGMGDVKLLARDVVVVPDDDPTDDEDNGKVALAMQTNLPIGADIGLDLTTPLLPTTVMTVSMDPDLMEYIAHRMLAEGEIATFYNEMGEPDPNGIYSVTLEDISASEVVGVTDRLNTTFRVWRIADGYCGYVEANMPLILGVNNAFQKLTVKAGDAQPVGGQGSGAEAIEHDDLIKDNQDLIDKFRSDLSEQIASAVNYESLSLADSNIIFTNQGVTVTPAELTSFIDFLVLAKE